MPGLLYPLIYGNKYKSKDMPNLSGKVIIVTGGNAGIGFQTTIALVRAGAKVYMGARSEAKAKQIGSHELYKCTLGCSGVQQ